MLTFQQLGDAVGTPNRPISLVAVAQVFGISVPFSFRQLSGAAQSGNVPRPFYIVGHNPNTIADVHAALDAGANAIEPDVNVYDDHEDQLCISHEEGDADAPSLSQFLMDLHDVAVNRPELALVVFDCKPKVATAQRGATLLHAIRTILTFDTNLNVIISAAHLVEGSDLQ
jgi:glycerophosphoryl diester phosphodiesterase